jgi:hypothetical protein
MKIRLEHPEAVKEFEVEHGHWRLVTHLLNDGRVYGQLFFVYGPPLEGVSSDILGVLPDAARTIRHIQDGTCAKASGAKPHAVATAPEAKHVVSACGDCVPWCPACGPACSHGENSFECATCKRG